MNRFAKGFRVLGGIIALGNLIVASMPVTVCTQHNYPTLSWSTFDYVMSILNKQIPSGEIAAIEMTREQMLWIACFMILPIILSVVSCIWGIVGGSRQIVSSVLSFVILGIYIGMFTGISKLWPVNVQNCVYSRGIAADLYIGVGIVGGILSLIAIVLTPRKRKISALKKIPNVEEMKQGKIQTKYNVVSEIEQSQQGEYIPNKPRGVMVGLKGVYAGAEIPCTSGEYIKFGRLTDNHLVFEGQEKVSRNHCKIKWDEGQQKYFIIDYSSNGTFINDSKDCLPQNLHIEITPGTVIALGDEKNTFRLE